MYQAKSSELERKINESDEQSRRLESAQETAQIELSEMESALHAQLEEKEELVRYYSLKGESLASKKGNILTFK